MVWNPMSMAVGAKHLFASLLKINLKVSYGVPEDAGRVHPVEVDLVEGVDLRLKYVDKFPPIRITRFFLALLPKAIVHLGRKAAAQMQERSLVAIDQVPVVECPTNATGTFVPWGHQPRIIGECCRS